MAVPVFANSDIYLGNFRMSRPELAPFIPPSYSAQVKILKDGVFDLTEGLISITFKKPEVSFKEILCEMNKFKMRYPDKAFKRLVIEVQDFGTVDPKSTGIGVENKVTTLTLDTCPTRLEKAQLKKKEDDAYKAKIQVKILAYNLFINVVI